MKKINFKNSSFIIFIIIAIFYAVGNFIWWLLNTPIYPNGTYAQRLMDVFSDRLFYMDAPLIIWITKFLFYLFGKTYFDLQIIFENYVFFLIGIFFIYKLGFELKNKMAGNIAMVLFALVPAIYGLSRIFSNQIYHFTLIMLFNIYCLIKLDDFKNTKWTFIYGITVGVGLLVKDAFVVFFFSPWLYVVIRSLIEKTDLKKVVNILLTIMIGCSISSCHYFRYVIIDKLLHDPIGETTPIFCFDSLKVLTLGLSEWIVSPLFFIVFLVALYWFFFKYKNRNKLIISLWFFIPWLIMMLMPHTRFKNYGVPFAPIIILIISLFLSNIKSSLIRKTVVCTLIIVGVIQYIDFSYGVLNINLFNKDINVCGRYQIKYYDKREFIEYDLEESKEKVELINILKEYENNIILKPYYIDCSLLCIAALNNLTMKDYFFSFEDIDSFIEEFEIEKSLFQDNKYIFLDKDSDYETLDDKILRISEDKYWFFSAVINLKKEEYLEKNVKHLSIFYDKLNDDMYITKTIYVSPNEIYKIYKNKN